MGIIAMNALRRLREGAVYARQEKTPAIEVAEVQKISASIEVLEFKPLGQSITVGA